MSKLVQKIDEMIEQRSLLGHPFYEMWSDGKLAQGALAGYSKEYFQLVKAVPSFMSPIIDKAPGDVVGELVENQREEYDHIGSWVKFAGELGVSEQELTEYHGLEKTNQAVSALSGLMDTFEGGACAMYAFEKEIPKVSQTKLDGLAGFYGITSDDATRYFRLHTEADIRHAASWRNILERCPDDSDNLIRVAGESIGAQHALLDGCYEAYC